MHPWTLPVVVEGVVPARLRRGPGVAPMGTDPHGSDTGVSPCPHRRLTDPHGVTDPLSSVSSNIVVRSKSSQCFSDTPRTA